MYKHAYKYIHCATSDLQRNLNYISDSGYELVHMSQAANDSWFIIYDINPKE